MPAANDKVILSIKLELKEAQKELKQLKAQVVDLQSKGDKGEKVDKTRRTKRTKEEQAAHKEKLHRYHEWLRLQKKESEGSKEVTAQTKKQHILLRDMSGMQKRMQERVAAFAKKHPWLTASARGVSHVPRMAARGVGFIGRTAAALGSGILGFVMGGIQQAYGVHLGIQQAMGGVTGMGTLRGYKAGTRVSGVGGGRLGYMQGQTWQHAAQVGRATGNIGAVYRAQQLARAGGGMDVGEAAGIMGQFRQGGIEFGNEAIGKGGKGTKILERVIAAGMATGLEKARLPEYLHGVSQFVEMQGGRQTGVVDVKGITAGLNMIMGMPGMTGKRGMDMAMKLDQMITSPGGGEAGQALALRAQGFGLPGGTADYYGAIKQQQRGLAGPGGAQSLVNMIKQVYEEGGGNLKAGGKADINQQSNLMLSDISKLTLDQVESLADMIGQGKSLEEIEKKIEEAVKESGPIDKQALDATKKGFTDTLKRLAGIEKHQDDLGKAFQKPIEDIENFQWAALGEVVKFFNEHKKEMYDSLKAMGDWARSKVVPVVKAGAEEYGKSREKLGRGVVGSALSAVGAAADEAHTRANIEEANRGLAETRKKYPQFPLSRIKEIHSKQRQIDAIDKKFRDDEHSIEERHELERLESAALSKEEQAEKNVETQKEAAAKELENARQRMNRTGAERGAERARRIIGTGGSSTAATAAGAISASTEAFGAAMGIKPPPPPVSAKVEKLLITQPTPVHPGVKPTKSMLNQ
jgi:hypothetical protein